MLIIYNTICNILALFCNALLLHGMENNKQNLPKNDRRSMSMNNIDRKIKKCIPMQRAHSFQNIFRKKLLLPFKFVSDCTACSRFNIISDIVTVSDHDISSSYRTQSTNKGSRS